MFNVRRFVLLLVGGGMLFAFDSPAQAGFPGQNGRIAFMIERTSDEGIFDEEIFDMRTDGSGQRNLSNNPAEDFHENYSPDGRRIVFSTFRDAGNAQDDVRNHAELYVMNANGANQRRITFNELPEKGPAWSPDGKHLVFWRSSALTGVGEPLPPGDLWILNLASGEERNVTQSPTVDDDEPQWSPDGTRIAFHSDAREAGNVDVYTIRPDGRELRRLTNTPAFDSDANYSPDSKRITFTSERRGNPDIFVMRADGARQTQLTDDPRGDVLSCFSPDGRFIAFTSEVGGDPFPDFPGFFFDDIFRMRADGSQRTNLTKSPAIEEFRPDWQPLGR
jgi:TolB protein